MFSSEIPIARRSARRSRLILPGVVPERTLISEDTNVFGVPAGIEEEDISGSVRSEDQLGKEIGEVGE